MKTKSFYEVLTEQMRTDLKAEIEAEIRQNWLKAEPPGPSDELGRSERLQTWLATHLQCATFKTKANPYPRSKAKRTSQSEPQADKTNTHGCQGTKAHLGSQIPSHRATTIEELCAIELLKRHGANIRDIFTEAELKTAWRKAAMQTHPDRYQGQDAITQAQMGAAFREIAESFEVLQAAFKLAA